MNRLCIIYEVDIQPKDSASQIASDFYPTKEEAVQEAREYDAKAYRIEVSNDGGLRQAVCRLAKSQGYAQTREEIANFTDQPAERFEG